MGRIREPSTKVIGRAYPGAGVIDLVIKNPKGITIARTDINLDQAEKLAHDLLAKVEQIKAFLDDR